MDLKRLFDEFPPDAVKWRVGSTNKDKTKGMALAYIDARLVMERLDDVCGVSNWQDKYSHVSKDGYVCDIGIRIDGEWIWKANGAGETQVEAEKGALSDAFKRAAVLWGVGRYLYDLKSPWVEIEPFGRSYKIKDSELPQLKDFLTKRKKAADDADAKQREQKDELRKKLDAAKAEMDKCATLQQLDDYYLNEERQAFLTKEHADDNVQSMVSHIKAHYAQRMKDLTEQQAMDKE